MKVSIALVVSQAALALSQCMRESECTDTEFLALETSECQQYHIFVARGSDSPYPGHQAGLVKLVCEELEDCGFENVIYPANSSYAGPDMWCKSAAIGVTNFQAQLTDYADKCPDSKLIVAGFSQGGSVSFDTLGGGGGPGFSCDDQASNEALDRTKSPGSHIAAAIVFGAVVRTAGQPYTVKGGEDFNGTRVRSPEHMKGLNQYASILREYCNFGDPVCAHGSEPANVDLHLNYFDLYNEEAAEWVIKTAKKPLEEYTGSNTNSNSNPSPNGNSRANSNSNNNSTTSDSSDTSASSIISVARESWFILGAVATSTFFFNVY